MREWGILEMCQQVELVRSSRDFYFSWWCVQVRADFSAAGCWGVGVCSGGCGGSARPARWGLECVWLCGGMEGGDGVGGVVCRLWSGGFRWASVWLGGG